MPARNSQRPPAAAAALTVDRPTIDTLQDQLVEFIATDNVPEMLKMLNETKKGKLSHEDRTVVNIVGLLNSTRIYSANEILRLFSSIHTYYPRKYKAVFKLKNAT